MLSSLTKIMEQKPSLNASASKQAYGEPLSVYCFIPGKPITAETYYHISTNLNENKLFLHHRLVNKRGPIIPRLHVLLMTLQKLMELGYDVLHLIFTTHLCSTDNPFPMFLKRRFLYIIYVVLLERNMPFCRLLL